MNVYGEKVGKGEQLETLCLWKMQVTSDSLRIHPDPPPGHFPIKLIRKWSGGGINVAVLSVLSLDPEESWCTGIPQNPDHLPE